ncbi:MAG: hypothetical protein JSW39_09845 [Desulfobacterales bacterium]|nr:MAG: hypothetical protein JSW39_09845 [Desulfobacterales bacterium]
MTIGDRIFWSIMCFVVITLLWIKFLEPYVPLWASLFLSAGAAVFVCTYKRRQAQ